MPENSKYYDQLLKIFKKKIKRLKKKAVMDGDEDNSEDEENSDDESDLESLDDDDDGDDDEDEEFCPPGCDPALYEKVTKVGLLPQN